jgi:hypothetical protein
MGTVKKERYIKNLFSDGFPDTLMGAGSGVFFHYALSHSPDTARDLACKGGMQSIKYQQAPKPVIAGEPEER